MRFRSEAHQVHFFNMVQHRTPNVEIHFQFHRSEFPNITAEIEKRGWTYLSNPPQGRMGITLLREFYANAKRTRRERASDPLYISHVRGKEIDFSPESIKVILQLPDVGVDGPSYEARKSSNDQRLDEVLRDICEDYAQWKLDIKGNPSQLKRRDLKPTAKGWFDFERRSLMPTSNANEVTVDRAFLVHSIMEGLRIKAELLISNHISATAESKDPNKRLPFTGVIYRLPYANGFKKKVQGDKLIPIEKPITADSIMKNKFLELQQEVQQQFPPQEHHQVQEEEDEQEQQHQQEQHFQPPPQQYNFPQQPQNFPQDFNWQEITQQFQGMRVEQTNQFKDFFDKQNSFFEDMRTQTKAYKQGFEDLRVQQHKKEYKEHCKVMKEAMEQQKQQFQTANQYWHRINSKNEEKIDYLCWGIQQVNPYLKARLPEDIPEWMQGNVQAGRGRFTDGMSHIPRSCWPGATSASENVEDKGKEKAEEGNIDERGKKKVWEARDKDLNE
ncbi:hypothetical protein PIB30_058499 [Stylosanthes scabra]|uniref:Putative plant transposon protein domain-containing protein n=1 Tax=Stylosanthes scabra TaxID=79078 RepID=A0ABU6TM31_9FABA|nr:hypothetical protein [Stylosanthes scabra]